MIVTLLVVFAAAAVLFVGLIAWLVVAWRRQESLPEYESDKEA